MFFSGQHVSYFCRGLAVWRNRGLVLPRGRASLEVSGCLSSLQSCGDVLGTWHIIKKVTATVLRLPQTKQMPQNNAKITSEHLSLSLSLSRSLSLSLSLVDCLVCTFLLFNMIHLLFFSSHSQ
ncbi:unnamed protein product [Boreogadus saida]